jgi:Na+-translocating ferredoxin:NAD+ oxidoreductase subunit E
MRIVSVNKESFVPNPILAGLVGLCPLAVASKSLAEGAAYGLGAALCSLFLGIVVPPLRDFLPDRLQAPVSLALSAALALIYGFCLRLYSPAIAAALWIYVPLLAASGLSLVALRQSSLQGRSGPDGQSRLAVIALQALLFLLSSTFVGALREAAGLGILTLPTPGASLSRVLLSDFAPLRILVSPAGGFMLLGFLAALYRVTLRASGRKGL